MEGRRRHASTSAGGRRFAPEAFAIVARRSPPGRSTMAASTPLYDLVLLLDSGAEDARRSEILRSVEEAVGNGGEIVNRQEWGARALAYEIAHKKDAEYHLLQFHGTPELLSRLDRTLRITDEVVRHRIIKLAPGTPAPPDQRPEPRPGAAGGDSPAEEPAYEAAPAGSLDPAE